MGPCWRSINLAGIYSLGKGSLECICFHAYFRCQKVAPHLSCLHVNRPQSTYHVRLYVSEAGNSTYAYFLLSFLYLFLFLFWLLSVFFTLCIDCSHLLMIFLKYFQTFQNFLHSSNKMNHWRGVIHKFLTTITVISQCVYSFLIFLPLRMSSSWCSSALLH